MFLTWKSPKANYWICYSLAINYKHVFCTSYRHSTLTGLRWRTNSTDRRQWSLISLLDDTTYVCVLNKAWLCGSIREARNNLRRLRGRLCSVRRRGRVLSLPVLCCYTFMQYDIYIRGVRIYCCTFISGTLFRNHYLSPYDISTMRTM